MGEKEVWKSFGNDTEAGRLLKKLYAGLEKANGVKYPKLRTKAHGDRPDFIPGGGKDGRSDPRVKTLVDSKIVVPKFGRPKPVGLKRKGGVSSLFFTDPLTLSDCCAACETLPFVGTPVRTLRVGVCVRRSMNVSV